MSIFTYKIQNIVNDKYYYGSTVAGKSRFYQHRTDLKRGDHHCIYLQRAYNKYGSDSFRYMIDIVFDNEEDARNHEQHIIDTVPNLYNTSKCASGGDLISYHPNKQEIIKKMKISLKKRYDNMTPEQRKQIYGKSGELNGMYGKTHTEEVKMKLSLRMKGNQYAKGTTRTEEHKLKLSKLAKNRKGSLYPFYGKHHSGKTKEILRQKNKGKLPTNIRPVIINGVEHESVTQAARNLGVSPGTIIYHIKKGRYHYKNP